MLPGIRLAADAVSAHRGQRSHRNRSEGISSPHQAQTIRTGLPVLRPADDRGGAGGTEDHAERKYGVSIWTELIVDKFLYGRPTHRLLRSWKALDLEVAAGTAAGGFACLAPMLVPLMRVFRDQQRHGTHWHADETGWNVFEFVEGKKTKRWYLWVYRSPSTIYFDLKPSRASSKRRRTCASQPKVLDAGQPAPGGVAVGHVQRHAVGVLGRQDGGYTAGVGVVSLSSSHRAGRVSIYSFSGVPIGKALAHFRKAVSRS